MGAPFDDVNADDVARMIRETPADAPFRYIVTPNVDHVVRLSKTPELRPLYEDAWLSLSDSKPVGLLARLLGVKLPHVTGSDLTARLFREIVQPGETVSLIAANAAVVDDLRRTFPHLEFRGHAPPQGVLGKPEALAECVRFAAAQPGKYLFLAIGAPQSERIAHMLARTPDAHGIGLCIGASLEFLTGAKKRAPGWMQAIGMEWAHRMATDPKRLWRRYVYAVPPLAKLFFAEMGGKRRATIPE